MALEDETSERTARGSGLIRGKSCAKPLAADLPDLTSLGCRGADADVYETLLLITIGQPFDEGFAASKQGLCRSRGFETLELVQLPNLRVNFQSDEPGTP